MEHRLSTNELANKLRGCNYTIVTEFYKHDPNTNGLYKIDHFEDANGNITDGVVVRDGYPLDCLLAEPGVNIKDEEDNISLKHSIIYGVEIYNDLKKIKLECSMNQDGVVRIWSDRRLALYDRFHRNGEKLTFEKFSKYVHQMKTNEELLGLYVKVKEIFEGSETPENKYSSLGRIEKECKGDNGSDYFGNLTPLGEFAFYVKGLKNFIKGEALKGFKV